MTNEIESLQRQLEKAQMALLKKIISSIIAKAF